MPNVAGVIKIITSDYVEIDYGYGNVARIPVRDDGYRALLDSYQIAPAFERPPAPTPEELRTSEDVGFGALQAEPKQPAPAFVPHHKNFPARALAVNDGFDCRLGSHPGQPHS
jgi:hypothetical protein